MMNVVLLGAPGSGKGTQAVQLAKIYNIPHISTGDIFRENIKNGTELGNMVKAVMDRGELCPDDLTTKIVADRLKQDDCKNGYLLDGFPRNVLQAEMLEQFSTVTATVNLDIPLDKLMRRLTGRRNCPSCGGSYHVDFIDGDKTKCPACGEKLAIRKDDNEETVNNRLSVYQKQTAPVIEYYEKQGKVVTINGDQPIDKVLGDIVEKLNGL